MSFYASELQQSASARRSSCTAAVPLVAFREPGAVLLAQLGEAAAEAFGDFISTAHLTAERNEEARAGGLSSGPVPPRGRPVF